MKREVTEPTVNEHGAEEHPSWGLIGVSRVQSHPGAVLFDSDIQHMHSVVLRIDTAERKRDLKHDWHHPEERIIEVQMSEAQWGAFVSSFGVGNGVPCTIRYMDGKMVPEAPYQPRLQESMDEVKRAADDAVKAVREARDAYEEKRTAANRRSLYHAIENLPSNLTFAAESLTKHTENVVTKARADIEAMALRAAEQVGLDPGDVVHPALGPGEGGEDGGADAGS